MEKNKLICIYGFALFGMFFGAGNLVFPLKIGQDTGNLWILGTLGLAITGIILPFLGLFAVKLHKGDYFAFFGEIDPWTKVILPFLLSSLLGPFGSAPRCITVAYGGMSHIMPEISLVTFSIIFSVVAFFVCLRDQRLISVVGKWMTPILLVFLAIMIARGGTYSHSESAEHLNTAGSAFLNGLVTGYQTMDLLAAFFFSSLIFSQIQRALPAKTPEKETFVIAVKAGVLASALLFIAYAGMVFLGANFSNIIQNADPATMLTIIADHIMGNSASIFIGLATMFACFTTVVALNSIYVKLLCNLFNIEQTKFVLLGTIMATFFVSLFDFKGIANFLVPMLETLYPGLIMITILSVAFKKQYNLRRILFYGTLVVMLLNKVM